MASADIVENAVKTVLADIEKNAPEEFKEMKEDPTKMKDIVQAARQAAEEHVKLAKEFADHTQDIQDIAKRLAKNLPESRIQLIKDGLTIPTYRMDINRRSDGNYWADITRDGKEFMPSRMMKTEEDFLKMSWLQMASIIVEAVMLVMSAVGIKIAVSEQTINKVAEEIIPVIQKSSALQKAVEGLKKAWASGSKWETAKAIFVLIKDSYSAAILWKIIKSLCSNMSTWDWIRTAAIVSAMIIAALATEGVALIAKIFLALNSAYDFLKKLTNLVQLSDLKATA